MTLTLKQEQAVKIACDRFRNHDKYTVISGYAGSGKSTVVSYVIEALNLPSWRIAYATYTGKAAEVLRKKGNKNAITLHKLLCKCHTDIDGVLHTSPKDSLDKDIVVVDECSMVPQSMVELLNQKASYVIYLGDPFQLPPISDTDTNTLLKNPHIFLDEIMRQAAESEIIQMSMKIRNGEKLTPFDGKEVKIFNASDLSVNILLWADQILCATNATRKNVNSSIRAWYNREGKPQIGDKIICCHNYWDVGSRDGNALINGTIGTIDRVNFRDVLMPKKVAFDKKINYMDCDLSISDGDQFCRLSIDTQNIVTGNYSLTNAETYQLSKMMRRKKYNGPKLPQSFEYGYAITTHKAQGSQWEKVAVIEERFPFEKVEHDRWLYTACTRAADKLVIFLNK